MDCKRTDSPPLKRHKTDTAAENKDLPSSETGTLRTGQEVKRMDTPPAIPVPDQPAGTSQMLPADEARTVQTTAIATLEEECNSLPDAARICNAIQTGLARIYELGQEESPNSKELKKESTGIDKIHRALEKISKYLHQIHQAGEEHNLDYDEIFEIFENINKSISNCWMHTKTKNYFAACLQINENTIDNINTLCTTLANNQEHE